MNYKQGAASLIRIIIGAVVKLKILFPATHYALLALLFIVGLELIFALQQWVIWVAGLVMSIVIVGVILVRLEEKETFQTYHITLPILATIGLSGFAFFLPTTWILHAYIIGSGLVLFWLLKHAVRQAYPLWNQVISLLVFFLTTCFILGLRFNLYLPIIVTLALISALNISIIWQALRRIVDNGSQIIVTVLVSSMILSEIAWMMQFLPAHYLVQGSMLTTIYYVILNLVSLSYQRSPQRQDFFEYLGIGMAALVIIVFSAQWI